MMKLKNGKQSLKEYETELAKINKEIGETGDKIGDISMDIIGRQNKYEKQLQSAISQVSLRMLSIKQKETDKLALIQHLKKHLMRAWTVL